MRKALELYYTDYDAYYARVKPDESPKRRRQAALVRLLANPSLRAVLAMRLANASPHALWWFWRSWFIHVHGMDWAGTLEIGPGFQLPHPHGTLLIQGAKIGRDVIILHNVTIGGVDDGRPVLGDRVRIFPGVVIYGSPTIGDDVVISANCVVHRDVPANSLVTQRGILPVKAAPILQAAEAAENTG